MQNEVTDTTIVKNAESFLDLTYDVEAVKNIEREGLSVHPIARTSTTVKRISKVTSRRFQRST